MCILARLSPACSKQNKSMSSGNSATSLRIYFGLQRNRRVKQAPLWGYLFCIVRCRASVALMASNGPKQFSEPGHLETGLPICKLAGFPIHSYSFCESINVNKSEAPIIHNTAKHLINMKTRPVKAKLFCEQEFSETFWTKDIKDVS